MNKTGKSYIELLSKIMHEGCQISPRGFEILEISDFPQVVNPLSPFLSFDDRHYPIEYFKKEMRWKLGANRYDNSIEEHAKMWTTVKNPDGTFNSNYGQYWFGEQMGIWSVITELTRDIDSRRAVIPMMNASHFAPHVKDTVCTESVGFRVRPGIRPSELHLHMSVHMRSSDVVFGLGTDVPTFAFLYRLVKAFVMSITPKEVLDGAITITSMSSHVYARHYEMVGKIIKRGIAGYIPIVMPQCGYKEALKIISSRGYPEILHDAGELGRWLCDD